MNQSPQKSSEPVITPSEYGAAKKIAAALKICQCKLDEGKVCRQCIIISAGLEGYGAGAVAIGRLRGGIMVLNTLEDKFKGSVRNKKAKDLVPFLVRMRLTIQERYDRPGYDGQKAADEGTREDKA